MPSFRDKLGFPEEFRAPLYNLNEMGFVGRVLNREMPWVPDSRAKTALHDARAPETRKL